ncbi:hypothetical protein Q9R46_11785 [Paenibacillus sp. RRE4]|uniref:hypothetical protein n=1 Tax=Paenibacillus sp. RRE4 TaxID=2962587 RepID=UPI0028816583|nr:hypothetical protein [Paenibacillus sp. RRE4]MDT0123327.1 hypothetical protein [Paenibacillus sp. RRE4]
MSREILRIIFRESAGNDKLVQKARELKRPCSIRFDLFCAPYYETEPSYMFEYIV